MISTEVSSLETHNIGRHAHNASTRHDAALKRVFLYLRASNMEACDSHTLTERCHLRPTATQTGHSALTPAVSLQGLSSSSTALLSTIFHQSNRPLPVPPQGLNLSPPTSPPGIPPDFKCSAAHGRSRSAPQPSVSTVSRSVRSLTGNKLGTLAQLPWASTTRDVSISHTPTA
jgi:hypothetical protein